MFMWSFGPLNQRQYCHKSSKGVYIAGLNLELRSLATTRLGRRIQHFGSPTESMYQYSFYTGLKGFLYHCFGACGLLYVL